MLTVSYTAGERLDEMLAQANAPDDAAIRLVFEGDGLNLEIDSARPGDTTFDHAETVVLVIDEQVSDLVADMKLVVRVTGEEEPELVLIERFEEADWDG